MDTKNHGLVSQSKGQKTVVTNQAKISLESALTRGFARFFSNIFGALFALSAETPRGLPETRLATWLKPQLSFPR